MFNDRRKKDLFLKHEQVFKALSNNSYKYLGNSGSGHLVKGYHNLIEYGFLQALAEGLLSIEKVSQDHKIDISLSDVCKIYMLKDWIYQYHQHQL